MDKLLNSSSSTCDSREEDTRRAKRLEYFTLGWNITEAAVAIIAGVAAGSIALMGFGADSLIESLSGMVMLWRLQSHSADEHRERLAVRLIGISFFILAVYVTIDAVHSIMQHELPESSITGIALAIVSLIIMPVLARAKRRVAARLESPALKADSRQTDICAYLSAILLGGLLFNAVFGWWWADPLAALLMVPIIIRDGINAMRGEPCSECCG